MIAYGRGLTEAATLVARFVGTGAGVNFGRTVVCAWGRLNTGPDFDPGATVALRAPDICEFVAEADARGLTSTTGAIDFEPGATAIFWRVRALVDSLPEVSGFLPSSNRINFELGATLRAG
jgi:hypothetical protein